MELNTAHIEKANDLATKLVTDSLASCPEEIDGLLVLLLTHRVITTALTRQGLI